MGKIIYNGSISPCRFRLGRIYYDRWERGEVKDVPEDLMNELLKNKEFSLVQKESKKSYKKVEPEKVIEEEVVEVSEPDFEYDYS